MEKYKPPYMITDRMLFLVSSISERIGKISEYHSLETKPHLRKNNKIQSIHSSLRIEANSLSLNEVREVINGHRVLGPAKEIQEVKNAYAAYEKIQTANPWSIQELKKIHGIMTAGIVRESGEFRSGEEGVFQGDTCIFVAPPARMVPGLMSELFQWMETEWRNVHPLILSAVFHYEFVFIHPFSDGNGRMARLWHTILLSKWKPVFEYIPIESQIEKFQDEYYQAIAKSHMNGDSNVFIEFMLERIDEILAELVGQLRTSDGQLSEYVKKLLDVMEYDVPYTANSLLESLDLKSKETFRKNYLGPALEKGLIVMTVPDKPRSRNQRYIRRG